MIVLRKKIKNEYCRRESFVLVLVFGTGLIGGSVVKELLGKSYVSIVTTNYSWNDRKIRADQGNMIFKYIKKIIGFDNCVIDFLWSAGKGGFSMDENQVKLEFQAFSDVLNLALSFKNAYPWCFIRFHMISSAGGLFEGQRFVDKNTRPFVKRSYGLLKYEQEEYLHKHSDLISFVYRPSSVYGYAGLHHRFGLIPTLLWNAITNKDSIIFGSPNTLRDYVYVDDVATFVSNTIQRNNKNSEQYILATGKPTSLYEVSSRIKQYLNKPLLLRYVRDSNNFTDNTYRFIPYSDWSPVDIDFGIRKTGMELFLNKN